METEFFQALFGEIPEGLRILIWTLADKRSAWAETWDEAAKLAEERSGGDVYVGVGLSGEDYGPRRRCSATDVRAIVGLWADIDIAGPAHRKPNLPPDEVAAEELLLASGLRPTMVVHSGHGLQAWWLFREPWVFESVAEWERAARLANRWTNTLRLHAQVKGWDVDATGDLSRVLRIPGSINTKLADDLRPVHLAQMYNELRYNPSDFDEWLIDDGTGFGKSSAREVNITLDTAAVPPFGKFEALGEAEPRFLRSWRHERRDLMDQSASAYDQSLATFAAQAGWADQEICDLLVAHRQKYGEELKRLDYYQRTISLAHGEGEQSRIFEAIDELISGENAPADEVEQRTALLAEISKLVGVEIRHVICHLADPPSYRLETASGSIELGTIKGLIDQAQFRTNVAAAARHYLPRFKNGLWDRLAQLLLNVCEDSETGEEAKNVGRAWSWLDLYLDANPPQPDKDSAGARRKPFIDGEGAVWVFGTSLRKWIAVTNLENVTAKEMGVVLKAAGCITRTISVHNGKKWTTASAWRVPERTEGNH